MLIQILKSKIHKAKVTDSCLDYEESITLDSKVMNSVGIQEYERVFIYNVNNGERWDTYAIKGKEREYILNGPSARKGQIGDILIICAYAYIDINEKILKPKIIKLNN